MGMSKNKKWKGKERREREYSRRFLYATRNPQFQIDLIFGISDVKTSSGRSNFSYTPENFRTVALHDLINSSPSLPPFRRGYIFFSFLVSLFSSVFFLFSFFFFIPRLRNSWTHQSRRNSTAEVTFDNESY